MSNKKDNILDGVENLYGIGGMIFLTKRGIAQIAFFLFLALVSYGSVGLFGEVFTALLIIGVIVYDTYFLGPPEQQIVRRVQSHYFRISEYGSAGGSQEFRLEKFTGQDRNKSKDWEVLETFETLEAAESRRSTLVEEFSQWYLNEYPKIKDGEAKKEDPDKMKFVNRH